MLFMNPKAIGELSEAKILTRVVERGFAPSIPFGNNQRYDLILDDGKTLTRAQCKTGWVENGAVVFQTASKNGFTGERTTYVGQIDIFLVYSPDTKKVYCVPVGDARAGGEMRLRFEPANAKAPKSRLNWAAKYEF